MKFLSVKRIIRGFDAAGFVLFLALPLFAQASPQAAEPQSPQTQTTQPAGAVVEQGKFILHKFENTIGEETYQIFPDGKSLAVKIDFKFTDRGSPVPVSATFRSSEDLTP